MHTLFDALLAPAYDAHGLAAPFVRAIPQSLAPLEGPLHAASYYGHGYDCC